MWRRNPKIALLLSAIVPGLGQFYNRNIWKGVVFLTISIVLGWMAMETVPSDALFTGELPSGVGSFMIVSLLFIVCCVLSIIDAYRSAKKDSPR